VTALEKALPALLIPDERFEFSSSGEEPKSKRQRNGTEAEEKEPKESKRQLKVTEATKTTKPKLYKESQLLPNLKYAINYCWYINRKEVMYWSTSARVQWSHKATKFTRV
jgi:hypothetical protein